MTVDINNFSLTGTSNAAFAPLTARGILPSFAASASPGAPIQRNDLDATVGNNPELGM